MFGIGALSTQLAVSSTKISECESIPRIGFEGRNPNSLFYKTNSTAGISCTFPFHSSLNADERFHIHFIPKASFSPVGSAEFTEEPATGVKFQKSLGLPSCSDTLSLLGTGHRERVFAIIGVKVYAAGLYANPSIISKLNAWKGRSYSEIQEDSSLFVAIFQAPLEKALQIILVRDVDGKTFWEALDDSVSPRIKAPTTADESALSTFRSIFQSRSLKKGTLIFLTWLNPSKMLVCISSDGIPSTVDATIESENVALAFFDVFFGDSSVSPSLKSSVANGLAMALK